MSAAASVSTVPGEIDPHKIYAKDEACRRMRWGRHAYAAALQDGLETKKAGRRTYIPGSALIDYVMRQPSSRRDGGRPDRTNPAA